MHQTRSQGTDATRSSNLAEMESQTTNIQTSTRQRNSSLRTENNPHREEKKEITHWCDSSPFKGQQKTNWARQEPQTSQSEEEKYSALPSPDLVSATQQIHQNTLYEQVGTANLSEIKKNGHDMTTLHVLITNSFLVCQQLANHRFSGPFHPHNHYRFAFCDLSSEFALFSDLWRLSFLKT